MDNILLLPCPEVVCLQLLKRRNRKIKIQFHYLWYSGITLCKNVPRGAFPVFLSYVIVKHSTSNRNWLVQRLEINTTSLHSGIFCSVAAHRPGSSLLPLSLPPFTVSTMWWVPAPLTVWGLVAGLPGFSRHGSSLNLGAGFQYWKF